MIYLILAILSSALVSITMRLSNKHVKNNMTMFLSNYAVCIILSIIFGLQIDTSAFNDGIAFPIMLGVISGIMYLGSFVLLQTNIKLNGVVLSATFMKLGVIVPTLMAIIIFNENPKANTIIGIIIALAAIIIINSNNDTKTAEQSRFRFLLIVLLLAGGFTDSLSNIYDKCGVSSLKDLYLMCTFFSAFICSLIMLFYKKQHFTVMDLVWGALIGIPNYFSARFLLLSLSQVQAMLVYPIYNIGAIVCVTLAGILFFSEKLSPKKWLSLGLILLSLILLNL